MGLVYHFVSLINTDIPLTVSLYYKWYRPRNECVLTD
jgi:hypothetical protein